MRRSIASSAKTLLPPICPIRWLCWAARGLLGSGQTAPGARALRSMPRCAILTAIGPFLYTRFAIPEALLSFLFLLALYCFLTGMESRRPARFYFMWAALALATLTKGLIAPVFFASAAIPLLLLSGQWRRWLQFRPFSGLLLFLLIAAPWHILAGLANPDQGHPIGNHPTPGNVHGFWYFYFVNEHFLRFLGSAFRTTTTSCRCLPIGCCTWSGSFPGASSCRRCFMVAWQTRKTWLQHLRRDAGQTVDFYLDYAAREDVASYVLRGQISRPHDLAAEPVLGFHAAVLLHLDQPGVLHLSGVAAAADSHRGRAGSIEEGIGRDGERTGVFRRPGSTARRPCLHWLESYPPRRWDGACGSRAACLLSPTSARCSPIATWATTRFRCRTCSISPARRLPRCDCPPSLALITLLVGPAAGWLLRRQGKHMAATVSVALTACCFSHRRAHRLRSLRADAEFQAHGRHHSPRRLPRRLIHHLRRSIRRFVGDLLYP